MKKVMNIYIHGLDKKSEVLWIPEDCSVVRLHNLRSDVPVESMCLSFFGRVMYNNTDVRDYGMTTCDCVEWCEK